MDTHVHTYIHVQLQVVSHSYLHTSEEAHVAFFLTMTLVKGGGSSLTECSWVAPFLGLESWFGPALSLPSVSQIYM